MQAAHERVWVYVEIDGKFTSGNLICSCLHSEPVTHHSTLQLQEEQNHSQSEDEPGWGWGGRLRCVPLPLEARTRIPTDGATAIIPRRPHAGLVHLWIQSATTATF